MQEVGMADGSIDPGDAFVFYGRKFHGSVQDEKYTDENVYWLYVDPSYAIHDSGHHPGTFHHATAHAHPYTATAHAPRSPL